MSTLQTQVHTSPLQRVPARALLWAAVVFGIVAALSFAYRQVDSWTSYEQPVVVTAVDGEHCTVEAIGADPLTMTLDCDRVTAEGSMVSAEYGGLSDQPSGQGINGVALWVMCVSGILALTATNMWRRRTAQSRASAQLHGIPHQLPQAVIAVAGDTVDDPVIRDRWRSPDPLSAGTLAQIRPMLPRWLIAALAVLTLPGAILITSSLLRAWGLPNPVPSLGGALVATGGLWIVWRVSTRSLRFTPEALVQRGTLKTRRLPWPDIHHASTVVHEGYTKAGHYWSVTPAVVMSSGVVEPLKVMSQNEGDAVSWRPVSVARRAVGNVNALDAWLDAADIPVDSSYDAMRAWVIGTLPVMDVVRLAQQRDDALHPVRGERFTPVEESVTNAPASGVEGGPGTAHDVDAVRPPPPSAKTSHVIRVIGWVLLAPVLAVTVVMIPTTIFDVVTGERVDVEVVGVDNKDCTLAEVSDPDTQWQARCEARWNLGDQVTVVIGGQTGDPTGWDELILALVGMFFFALPGLLFLTLGYLMRRSRRAYYPPTPT